MKEYAEVYEKAKKLDAEILAISSDTPGEIEEYLKKVPLPFPLLSDRDGKITAQFTYIDSQRNASFPSIFITDRFGELYYQKIVSEADELPSGDENPRLVLVHTNPMSRMLSPVTVRFWERLH